MSPNQGFIITAASQRRGNVPSYVLYYGPFESAQDAVDLISERGWERTHVSHQLLIEPESQNNDQQSEPSAPPQSKQRGSQPAVRVNGLTCPLVDATQPVPNIRHLMQQLAYQGVVDATTTAEVAYIKALLVILGQLHPFYLQYGLTEEAIRMAVRRHLNLPA